MNPRPLPKKFEKTWQKWPTFDDLRAQHPAVKVHQLRAALGAVPCYRCPDQSARYMPDRAATALTIGTVESDDDDETPEVDRTELELAEPKVYDAMVLFRQSMAIVNDMRKSFADLATAMGEPLRLGLQLVREQTELMNGRLKHYETVADRMQLVTESLLSEQANREIAAARAKASNELRTKTLDVAAQYLPRIVDNFKPTLEASIALDAVKSLEPEVLDGIANSSDLSEMQRHAWTKVRELIRSNHPPQQNDQSESTNHAATPPS